MQILGRNYTTLVITNKQNIVLAIIFEENGELKFAKKTGVLVYVLLDDGTYEACPDGSIRFVPPSPFENNVISFKDVLRRKGIDRLT